MLPFQINPVRFALEASAAVEFRCEEANISDCHMIRTISGAMVCLEYALISLFIPYLAERFPNTRTSRITTDSISLTMVSHARFVTATCHFLFATTGYRDSVVYMVIWIAVVQVLIALAFR